MLTAPRLPVTPSVPSNSPAVTKNHVDTPDNCDFFPVFSGPFVQLHALLEHDETADLLPLHLAPTDTPSNDMNLCFRPVHRPTGSGACPLCSADHRTIIPPKSSRQSDFCPQVGRPRREVPKRGGIRQCLPVDAFAGQGLAEPSKYLQWARCTSPQDLRNKPPEPDRNGPTEIQEWFACPGC